VGETPCFRSPTGIQVYEESLPICVLAGYLCLDPLLEDVTALLLRTNLVLQQAFSKKDADKIAGFNFPAPFMATFAECAKMAYSLPVRLKVGSGIRRPFINFLDMTHFTFIKNNNFLSALGQVPELLVDVLRVMHKKEHVETFIWEMRRVAGGGDKMVSQRTTNETWYVLERPRHPGYW